MIQPPFLNNWPTICEKNVQCQQVELTNPPTLRNEMVGGFFVICTSITSVCAKGIRNGFHAGRIQRNQIDTCGIFLAELKIHSAIDFYSYGGFSTYVYKLLETNVRCFSVEQKKEYRSAIRSRRLIRESLISLLKEKDISKITVKDIVDCADLNRATFYAHYPDVRGVMEGNPDRCQI